MLSARCCLWFYEGLQWFAFIKPGWGICLLEWGKTLAVIFSTPQLKPKLQYSPVDTVASKYKHATFILTTSTAADRDAMLSLIHWPCFMAETTSEPSGEDGDDADGVRVITVEAKRFCCRLMRGFFCWRNRIIRGREICLSWDQLRWSGEFLLDRSKLDGGLRGKTLKLFDGVVVSLYKRRNDRGDFISVQVRNESYDPPFLSILAWKQGHHWRRLSLDRRNTICSGLCGYQGWRC